MLYTVLRRQSVCVGGGGWGVATPLNFGGGWIQTPPDFEKKKFTCTHKTSIL